MKTGPVGCMYTGLCINFSTVLKTIAILVRKYLPVPILGLNLSKSYYLTILLFFLFSSVDIDSLSFLTMELYGRQLLKV